MVRYTMPANNILPTLRHSILADGFHVVIDLEKSQGSWIHDAVSGKRILDFYSYFASLPVGHNHPRLIGDPDFMKALTRAAVANPSNSDIYTREFAAFVETFADLAMTADFNHLFFVAGGSLAVENALKTAFDWKHRRNRHAGNADLGNKILHFREAFHGRSGYTLSLTNTDPVKTDDFPKFNWPRIVNPKLEFPVTPAIESAVIALEHQALDEMERTFDAAPGDIAAIIIEPIQGEGGDNHFRTEFFQRLRQVADDRDALLIFDEVQTGFGLTGKFWAFQHFGVSPDICCFGKKAQVCGIMAGKRIDEVEGNVFETPGRINTTWGGNLVDMVRGAKYLEIIHEEKLVDNAAVMGERLIVGLEQLGAIHKDVSNVRGRGLFTAFSLPTPEHRDHLRTQCWDNGLATLASGSRAIRFRPCLNVRADEIDDALEILETSLRALSTQK